MYKNEPEFITFFTITPPSRTAVTVSDKQTAVQFLAKQLPLFAFKRQSRTGNLVCIDQIQCVWPRNLLVWASSLSNDNGIHFAGWRRLSPTTTRDWLLTYLMLAHRHRRRPNINPTPGQRLTFAGISTGDVWTAASANRDDSFLWPDFYRTMSMSMFQPNTSNQPRSPGTLTRCWVNAGPASETLAQH